MGGIATRIVRTRAGARRRLARWLCALAIVPLAGCVAGAPVAPHTRVARVPPPRQADPALDMETLHEMYTVSPDVDPDGLGAADWIWDQSYMTLVVWPYEVQREERARIAYARSDHEQREKLAQDRVLVQDHVLFEGVLVGDYAELVHVENYQPEGIYLLDDRGEKFYPLSVKSVEPLVPEAAERRSEFGTAHIGYPQIAFPQQAITARTRGVSLYLAFPDRRIRFTWIFDPDYTPPEGIGAGGRRALWPAR